MTRSEALEMTLMSVPTELVPEIRACSPASRPPDPAAAADPATGGVWSGSWLW